MLRTDQKIKILLIKQDLSIKVLAHRIHYHPIYVSMIINGYRSPRVENAIAHALGVEVAELWPDRAEETVT